MSKNLPSLLASGIIRFIPHPPPCVLTPASTSCLPRFSFALFPHPPKSCLSTIRVVPHADPPRAGCNLMIRRGVHIRRMQTSRWYVVAHAPMPGTRSIGALQINLKPVSVPNRDGDNVVDLQRRFSSRRSGIFLVPSVGVTLASNA